MPGADDVLSGHPASLPWKKPSLFCEYDTSRQFVCWWRRLRMCRPAQRYGVGGRCGERSTSRVISLGAKMRKGGPQKPVPRLV